jgi:hypothetical protein
MNSSTLSSSLPPLKVLHDALVTGTCKFVKLTAVERKARETAYMAKIASGGLRNLHMSVVKGAYNTLYLDTAVQPSGAMVSMPLPQFNGSILVNGILLLLLI